MEAKWTSSTPSAAHPETMDVLSRAWCNFAVQTLHPELQEKPLFLIDSPIKDLDGVSLSSDPFPKVENTVKMEADDHVKPIPPWKSNDMKSFIWMQQAMHPELNYSSYFRKKWFQWKIVPFKNFSIKKWLKEIRRNRKDEDRLQRAEIHAAISVAGVAAALAAIAADSSRKDDNSGCGKDAAVASAAALVAAQCAQVAEAMGAKREQLSSVIGSAMSSTSASDILTLTAAAATSLKGAATLKARSEYKNISTGVASVLPIEDNHEIDFNFEKSRSTLSKGVILKVESPNGKYKKRSISVIQNTDTKVIMKIRKLNMLKTKQESVVLDMYIELYKDEDEDDDDNDDEEIHTCYLIILTTNRGIFKVDMGNDYQKYKIWATTINQMLMLSTTSFTRL